MAPAATATIQLGPIRIDFLVDADDSAGSVTVFECSVPVGSRVPVPHSHDAFEETIYGLEGTCTWTIDGETLEIRRGGSACIRRGQVHGFDNRSDGDVKFLAIATPGILGPAYFQDLADILAAGGPPDPAAMKAVMLRHGLTPAPPMTA